jgi:hypothetical protein
LLVVLVAVEEMLTAVLQVSVVLVQPIKVLLVVMRQCNPQHMLVAVAVAQVVSAVMVQAVRLVVQVVSVFLLLLLVLLWAVVVVVVVERQRPVPYQVAVAQVVLHLAQVRLVLRTQAVVVAVVEILL